MSRNMDRLCATNTSISSSDARRMLKPSGNFIAAMIFALRMVQKNYFPNLFLLLPQSSPHLHNIRTGKTSFQLARTVSAHADSFEQTYERAGDPPKYSISRLVSFLRAPLYRRCALSKISGLPAGLVLESFV